jgi:hypothetical protein
LVHTKNWLRKKKRHIKPKPGQEFYSFSKLTILQSLSLSNYSNTSENPGIHTSEYVGSTRIHRKFFFEAPETSLRISTNVTKKQKQKKSPPTKQMSFEVVMLTPIVKIKILIKEIFGFIKNHKSYASLKFLSSE